MTTDPAAQQTRPAPDGTDSELNYVIRYVMYSVFRVERPGPVDRDGEVADVEAFLGGLEGQGVTLRGVYDVSGMRADADLMLWWHADGLESLQRAYNAFRRTGWGQRLAPVWSSVGLHRPAEFNRSHVPAFLAGEPAGAYVCVYPFVRSYDWYLLPDDDRRTMLRDHGMAARDYADVRANTISAFALGDYEWLLAFEADDLHRIVDLMRELRGVEARRHVREEVPFFTGPRVGARELVERLP